MSEQLSSWSKPKSRLGNEMEETSLRLRAHYKPEHVRQLYFLCYALLVDEISATHSESTLEVFDQVVDVLDSH